MMEAIQIGPAVFGPLPLGSGGGHGNTVARGISGLQDIFSKTRSIDLTAQEGAQNTLTDLQEFKWGDIFMTFNYQKKGEKFFANGRPIEDINDPNEVGGDRMGRVITALNQMAADKNIEEAIVVSEDLGYGRHFIYRYRRGEGDKIEGLAFEYQGKTAELRSVVNQLSERAIVSPGKNASTFSDFSKPLFFTNENRNSEVDLARAASNSFNSGERRRDMKRYLDRLNRDTDGFNELMHRRKMQEEELVKQFEKTILSNPDAKAGIATAVYGAIDIARKMEFREDRRREEIQPVNVRVASRDILSLFAHGIVAIPGLIDHTGRLLDQNEMSKKVFTKSEEEAQAKEHVVSQIIGLAVPGILDLSATIISFPIDSLVEDQKSEPNDNEVDKLMFWQEIVSVIIGPVDAENKVSSEEKSEFILEKTSFSEALAGFIPRIRVEEVNKPLLIDDKGEQEMLIASFQRGLEVIVGLIERYERNNTVVPPEETIKQKILEHDIVTLSKALFGLLISHENKPYIDALGRVAFLLHVYEGPNLGELVKSFVVVLIYKQIQQFREKRLDFKENSEIAEIFEKMDKLSPFASNLSERFNILLSVLQNFYLTINYHDEDLVGKLIFLITIIDKKQELFSFEKIKNTGCPNMANFFFQRRKNSKRKKHGIIYQYSRYLSGAVDV